MRTLFRVYGLALRVRARMRETYWWYFRTEEYFDSKYPLNEELRRQLAEEDWHGARLIEKRLDAEWSPKRTSEGPGPDCPKRSGWDAKTASGQSTLSSQLMPHSAGRPSTIGLGSGESGKSRPNTLSSGSSRSSPRCETGLDNVVNYVVRYGNYERGRSGQRVAKRRTQDPRWMSVFPNHGCSGRGLAGLEERFTWVSS